MPSLLKRWGLGAEVVWKSSAAERGMVRTQRQVKATRQEFDRLKGSAQKIGIGLAGMTAALAPLGIGMGLIAGQGSRLAADLEAQQLTMRVLLGDAAKAEGLISAIRREAASTPFQEGDLIEGSKRLLRLTGDNVDANLELLKLMETMTALNPTKGLLDSVEGLLDATSGGGFERLKEFGLSFRAEDFESAGRPGGKAWADAVIAAIQDRMDEVTRGEDLVGALSRTFTGRLSTFRDSITNALRGAGQSLNAALGPPLVALTAFINDEFAPAFVGGFTRLIDRVTDLWNAHLKPIGEELLELWRGLGQEGQARLMEAAVGVGALSAALLPLAAAGGAATLFLSGLVNTINGLITLGPAIVGFATSAKAAIVTFATTALGAIGPLGWALIGLGALVVGTFLAMEDPIGRITGAWAAFAGTVAQVLGPAIERARDIVGAALGSLTTDMGVFLRMLGGEGVNLDMWRFLGQLFAETIAPAVAIVSSVFAAAVNVLSVVAQVLRPIILAIGEILGGFVDLVTGSTSVGDAITRMLTGALGVVAGIVGGVATLIIGAVETVVRFVGDLVSQIPGVEQFLGGPLENPAADLLGRARQKIEDEITFATTGIDLAAQRRDAEARAAAAPTVIAQAGEVTADVTVQTDVKVGDSTIARANGAAQVRAGERGKGPALPPRQRGQVLRGGGQVTPLRPAEVL